jgi:hypothetical protein
MARILPKTIEEEIAQNLKTERDELKAMLYDVVATLYTRSEVWDDVLDEDVKNWFRVERYERKRQHEAQKSITLQRINDQIADLLRQKELLMMNFSRRVFSHG